MTSQPPTPIAIIGIGCRFPGGANSPEKLWEMLSEGRSGWSKVPADRWNNDAFYHGHSESQDGFEMKGGHFIDQDVAAFDPAFFGISSHEAESIDPQQRLLLEATYEALENAGVPQEKIRGSDTGVYAAYFTRDYDKLVFKDTSDIPKQHITGGGDAIISNRISYVFDLKGPSMTIDTGCSGSMVALHLACQSLQSGETAMSLVGGVNLHLIPDYFVAMSFANILNKDGKCYTFDSRGAGYGRGEGSATIVLKRLDKALEDGDHIRGVIRNSSINQDGKTNGISLPNKQAQKDLVRSIYQSTGLDPRDTGYVEAHGTGTVVGDNAEIESIAELFCENGKREDDVYVGSVKTNIGHLEAVSGLAGLIKAILVLEKGWIPPNLNLEIPKTGLHLEERKIKVAQKLTPWPKDGVRRASINSYGYGGTNCHAILEAAPDTHHKGHTNGTKTNGVRTANGTHGHGTKTHANGTYTNGVTTNGIKTNGTLDQPVNENGTSPLTGNGVSHSENSRTAHLFAITAKSKKSLPSICENIRQGLISHEGDEGYLRDLAYTLSCRRSLLQWRTSISASSHGELYAALDRDALRMVKASNNNQVAFLFTGQGAQWHAMGRELISRYAVFKESLNASSRILKQLGAEWDLIEELMQDKLSSKVNQSEISQPVTTTIQIALVDLLASFNIKPQAVLGHSSGEIGAAYSAGALSHESALTVSYRRGFVANACRRVISGGGAMLAVGVGEDEINLFIERLRTGIVCVACVNSPSSTTISGDVAAIEELSVLLNEASIFNRKLKVDVAYHSHHMRKVSAQYLESIQDLVTQEPNPDVRFFSSVTGSQKTSGFGALYWVENLVSQVKFSKGLKELGLDQQAGLTFIEVGPHSALQGPVRQTIPQSDQGSLKYSYSPTLIRDKDAIATILDMNKILFESGYPVDLGAVNSENDLKKLKVVNDLAPYPWDHSVKYWKESRLSRDHRLRQHPSHDLLGLRIVSSTMMEPVWRHIISIDSLPWLKDHVVDNSVVFPGAGYLCMAIEGIRQISQDRRVSGTILNYVIRDVSFYKALVIPEAPGKVEMLLTLRPSTKNVSDRTSGLWESFRISSLSPDGTWSEHCDGTISVELAQTNYDEVEGHREGQFKANEHQEELKSVRNGTPKEVDTEAMYRELAKNGNNYGPSFAAVKELRLGDRMGLATIKVPEIPAFMPSGFFQPHIIHPTTLDALMQIGVPLFNQHCGTGAIMPVFTGEIAISANILSVPGTNLTVTTKVSPAGSNAMTFNSTAFQVEDGHHTPVIRLSNGDVRRVGEAASASNQPVNSRSNYTVEWNPDVNFITQETMLRAADNIESPELMLQKIDRASSLYINQCLQKIGDNLSTIRHDHHLELFRWMQRYSATEKYKSLIEEVGDLEELSLHQSGVEGEIITRLGSKLEKILLGEVDPLSLMLEGDLLYRVYVDSFSNQQCYLHMKKYLKLLSFKNPFMRILEIGAGTGSATTHVLEALSHEEGIWIDRLDFTDISSGFFDKAKPKLEEYASYIEFKTLDIEKDLLNQGFEAGSYDLIVASNVLHATSRIDDTLANVRALLKPGGRLALVEITELRAYINITFGTLPGWWAGVEDGRTDSPLLSLDGWETALSKNGFDGVEVAVGDYENSAHTGSFIVSKAIGEKSALKPVEVICSSSYSTVIQDFANDLVASYQHNGFSASIKPWPSQVQRGVIYVVIDDGGKPLLVHPTKEQFHQVSSLTTGAEAVVWISAHDDSSADTNPERGLVTGLLRVARVENSESNIVVVDIQQSVSKDREKVVAAMSNLLSQTFEPISEDERSTEVEFVYKDGQLHISRALPDVDLNRYIEAGKPKTDLGPFHQPGRSLKLQVEKSGLLDSLVFVDDDAAEPQIGPDEIEIETRAHGVNFKDVYIALGQMKPTERMTGESAGIVTKVGSKFTSKFKVGDRVAGMCSYSPFATRPRVLGNCAHRLPDSMPFTVGASIPIIYLTAWISLVKIAKLRKGQTVLIHAASGGVGQAAIMIAQHFGAEIFATVGSTSKSQLLVERYGIPQSHIFSSRMRTFKQGVLRLTKGKGVDVVLNSLSGEVLHDTWACIAACGTFVEIGKADILKRNSLSMSPFDKMVTFASFDLGVLRDVRSEDIAVGFAEVMALFEEGSLKAVEPVTPYKISEIEDAFRLIQARKHRGKIVLTSEEDSIVKIKSLRPPLKLPNNGTFVIGGGLGDLGRRFCRFLAEHGVKHIVTLSRRGLAGEERRLFQEEIATLGAEIHIFACDVNDRESVQGIATLCRETLPPVKGLVQAAMVLRDGNLETMEYDVFMTALKPKFDGTRHLLDAFSSPSLEHIVMLSSVAGIIGNPGQGNYAAGCTYQDALANCQTLEKHDTHIVSLNLALIEGSEVDTPERRAKLLAQGIVPVTMSELLGILEYSLSSQSREDGCTQIINRLDRDSMSNRLNGLTKLPMLNHLQKISSDKDAKAGRSTSMDIEGAISSATSLENAKDIISNAVIAKISSLVALSAEDISIEVTLAELGLDSLVAIELKNWIVRSLQSPIQTVELLDMPNIRHLVNTIIERSALVSKDLQASSAETPLRESKATNAQRDPDNGHGFKCCSSVKEIRKLPLLDLKQLLESYLGGIRALVNEEEYAHSVEATEEFLQPGGNGQQLYERLVKMQNDPSVENWMEDLYLQEMYLRRREPVALYYDIMCSFGTFPISHSQAERAAIIAATSFKYKQDLETNKTSPDYLHEIPLCMDGQHWLFNTTRNPLPQEDEVIRYTGPDYDYLIVLRFGHFFKVPLMDGIERASIEKLGSTFRSILNLELEESWVGILTTDDRDLWATNRKNLITLNPANEKTVKIIEGASFLICLDDDISPTTGVERIRQFMLGRGINRWHDKSLQFIVAKNAATAFIGDHTKLDGASVQPLLRQIKETITTHQPGPSLYDSSNIVYEEIAFETSQSIEGEVARVRQTWLDQVNGTDYDVLEYTGFGATYLKDLKCNTQSGFEVVAQLASLMMFGQAYACWQPVNMSHYHKGRTEVIQTMTPTMLEFCTLALQEPAASSNEACRKLFFEAAREHATAVMRAHSGFGYHRTLTAMECLAKKEGYSEDNVPALYSDKAWLKTYPHYIMTGPRDGLLSDVASVWPGEASLFVNYDVHPDGARFCIVGHNGRAQKYSKLIEKAAGIVKSILSQG